MDKEWESVTSATFYIPLPPKQQESGRALHSNPKPTVPVQPGFTKQVELPLAGQIQDKKRNP